MGGRDYGSKLTKPAFSVSTHAPVGGRDNSLNELIFERRRFNSRARGRARHAIDQDLTEEFIVSTHAPVGGRDWLTWPEPALKHSVSTHAPVGGRDRGAGGDALMLTGFNSRARGRARPRRRKPSNTCPRFNSRARGRARPQQLAAQIPDSEVSTHAPVGGRDLPGT